MIAELDCSTHVIPSQDHPEPTQDGDWLSHPTSAEVSLFMVGCGARDSPEHQCGSHLGSFAVRVPGSVGGLGAGT